MRSVDSCSCSFFFEVAVVSAFEAAEAEGSASIQLDGYFIDYPIVYKAQRVLALMAQLEDGTPR